MAAGPLLRKGQQYTFLRYTPPKINQGTGQLTRATAILNNGNPWTMLASIQPMTGMQVLMLPEGFRDRQGVSVYCDTLLQVADEAKQLFGDRFTWNGYLYECTFRQDWITAPLTNAHFKFLAFRPKPGSAV